MQSTILAAIGIVAVILSVLRFATIFYLSSTGAQKSGPVGVSYSLTGQNLAVQGIFFLILYVLCLAADLALKEGTGQILSFSTLLIAIMTITAAIVAWKAQFHRLKRHPKFGRIG